MATPSALDTLIDLAQRETDDAAQYLGEALRAGEEARQKLDLLQQYRDDYDARCQASLGQGISATHLLNFQAFMQKLEGAIAGQRKVVDDAQSRVARARAAWQRCEQKKMSFVTLAERADLATARRELRREQKQNDEFAARRTSCKPTAF
jgi:flagellar FliJ protein